MATSGASISGAVSGLDTQSLINSLITAESGSQTLIKNKQTKAQSAADAYTKIITQISGLGDKAAALAKTSGWVGSTASSSSTSVTASVTGSANGSITFDVTAVAKAHTLVSASAVASTDTSVASTGEITVLDKDGSARGVVDVGGGTLAEVVTGINSSNLGLRAAAVQTSPGQYRLQVTSSTSGAAAEFSLDGVDGFTPPGPGTDQMNVLTAGADAKLRVGGTSDFAYDVTSSTNTFKDLVPGLSFTVSKQGETGVTVGATVDGSAVSDQIKSMVDAANSAMSALSAATAYDTGSNKGAALYGESNIKMLQQSILNTVSGAGAPGISLTKDGTISFDADAFKKAFVADPVKTAAAYGAQTTFAAGSGVSSQITMRASNASTRAGTYAVAASVAAAKEAWSANPTPGGTSIVVTKGAMSIAVTVGVGGLADAVAEINQRSAAAGVGITASIQMPAGTGIDFSAISAGAGGAFTVTTNGSPATQTRAGRDVAGTIDGKPATGVGNVLYSTATTSGANGLRLQVDASDAEIAASGGQLGSVTYKPGLAQRLSNLLDQASNSTSGSLTQAKNSRLADVKDLQKQVEAWDLRLEARRASLTKQFTAMETALSSLKSSTSAISSLISS